MGTQRATREPLHPIWRRRLDGKFAATCFQPLDHRLNVAADLKLNEAFEFFTRLGLPYFCFHDVDVMAQAGTGVIGADGLILTIGYLILEADSILVLTPDGRVFPAVAIGFDHATGFGLLRSIVPLDAKPIALGSSARLGEREPVLIASHTGANDVSFAWVVSQRPFSGNWEYMLDTALWTSPPTMNWSGAGLIDREGRLVGIGSLIVRDATGEEPRLPGNLFVPIDALKPILAEMIADGRRKGPQRPWLGVAADELQGRLVVSRVSPGGPAEEAGVQVGDIILGVAGEAVKTQGEFYRKLWTGRSAGADVSLRLLQGADVRELNVRSIDRIEYFRPRTTY